MTEQRTDGKCPPKEALIKFAERTLSAEESVEVVAHAVNCSQCVRMISDYVESLAAGISPEQCDGDRLLEWRGRQAIARMREKSQVWQGVFSMFEPVGEHLAAAAGQTPDQMQAEMAVKSGFVHFISVVDKTHRQYWHVRMSIPVTVTDQSELRFQVYEKDDGEGERPVDVGVLKFCGSILEVKKGRASIPVSSFGKAERRPIISLVRESVGEMPGEPVLGYGMCE